MFTNYIVFYLFYYYLLQKRIEDNISYINLVISNFAYINLIFLICLK